MIAMFVFHTSRPAVFLAGVFLCAAAGHAVSPQKALVELAPHRAIYEMKLAKSHAGSNVSYLDGLLIIEFNGSSCEGYVQSTQLITNTADWNGKETVSDMRSSSWEDGAGQRYRFHSTRLMNAQINEVIEGDAAREKKSIRVALKKPAQNRLRIAGDAMFPTQHSIAVLDAAARGQFSLQANLYDGLDKGEKVFATTTVIGKPLAPGANRDLKPVAEAKALDGLTSWPITISYFDMEKKPDILPAYEIKYRLYANGVSRKLNIDYGHFSIDGELSRIEFLKPADCPAGAAKATRR